MRHEKITRDAFLNHLLYLEKIPVPTLSESKGWSTSTLPEFASLRFYEFRRDLRDIAIVATTLVT